MSPLMQLRYCIVKFLGDLGGSINKELVKGGRTPDLSNAVTWDTAKHLSFALPFCDMKPTIYLGKWVAANSSLLCSFSVLIVSL